MSYQTKVRANNMNKTAKLAFYNARKRDGDTTRLAEETGYTTRFINYVKAGERSVNDAIANAMYNLARRRTKTNELATA
jgi:hypothetical protein